MVVLTIFNGYNHFVMIRFTLYFLCIVAVITEEEILQVLTFLVCVVISLSLYTIMQVG